MAVEPRLARREFGRLTVRRLIGTDGRGNQIYGCDCACGAKDVPAWNASLENGEQVSCGCWRRERMAAIGAAKLRDLTESTFGRWTVEGRAPSRPGDRSTYWRCRCTCGRVAAVTADRLLRGTSTRCRPCSLAATWDKTCKTCGREYVGTVRQQFCSVGCRPANPPAA